MQVRDKLTGLFTKIKEKKSLLIFSHIDETTLDNMYINLYGDKTLSKIGKLDNDIIVNMLVNMFGEKWDRSIENFLKSTIGITEGGYKIIENSSSEGINNLSRNVLNKVSAFNDEVLTDNNEDVEELAGTNNNITDLEKQVINKIRIDEIEKIINYLNNYYIYDIMMLDINEILTLKIYY